MLYQYARQTAQLGGEVAEIGVYKGGTAKLLAILCARNSKSLHLFDTFEGLPPTDLEKDILKEGDFGDTSLQKVQSFLDDNANVTLYPGIFPATSAPIEDKIFCLVHIDVDIFQSVMDCCHFYYPRVVPGGMMVFDDYGDISCPGAKMAVDEFFRDKPAKPLLSAYRSVCRLPFRIVN